MMDDFAEISDRVNALVAENRHLRTANETCNATIDVLRQQYDKLEARHGDAIKRHETIEHRLTVECDRAKLAYAEIDGLLTQAAELIMTALHKRIGDRTPDPMPKAQLPHVNDDRIPPVVLNTERDERSLSEVVSGIERLARRPLR
jgi:hypothetical protein